VLPEQARAGTFAGQVLLLSRGMGLWDVVFGGALVSFTFDALAVALGARRQTMLRNPWATAAPCVVIAMVAWFAYRAVRRSLEHGRDRGSLGAGVRPRFDAETVLEHGALLEHAHWPPGPRL